MSLIGAVLKGTKEFKKQIQKANSKSFSKVCPCPGNSRRS